MTTRIEHDSAVQGALDLFERAAGREYTRDELRLLKRYSATRDAYLASVSHLTPASLT